MSIASRISSIEEHLRQSYQELEGIGIDTTGVNKNLENIPKLIDGYWETLPKVTGEGTSITLDNTKEGKMKINLKGNTSQEGTPTPEAPQDIHVVSGDNTIKVERKNLFNSSVERKNAYPHASGGDIGKTLVYDNSSATYSYVKCTYVESDKTYTIKWTQTTTPASVNIRIGVIVDENNIVLQTQPTWYNSSNVLTFTPTYSGYLILATDINATNIQIEKGSTATTYETYQNASYPISLGVENLLNNILTTQTLNGVTATKNDDGSVTLNGTATAQTDFTFLNTNLELEDGTYTFSISDVGNSNVRLQYGVTGYGIMDTGTATTSYTTTFPNSSTGTSFSYINMYRVRIVNGAVLNNYTIYPMIEKGSKANSYSEYGTTPIELCKIGDYQDYIAKSTGKNLLQEGFRQGNTTSTTATNRIFTENSTYLKANQTYTISTNINTSNFYWTIRVASSEFPTNADIYTGDWLTSSSYTYTPTQNCYLGIIIGKRDLNASITPSEIGNTHFQIEEGSTALPYEPYGKVWYLNKQIGKVVLNGTQNITLATSGTRRFNATYTTLGITNIKEGTSAEDTTLHYRMCDHFIYSAGQSTWGRYYLYNNWLVMLDVGSVMSDANALKTWLGNNNTSIYYVLATPTTTEITDSTLISQLETVKRSFNEQTNITQTNDDLPFILNVTALKELTQ